MMTKNTFAQFSLILIVVMLLGACGGNAKDESGQALTQRTLNITMIGSSKNDPISLSAKRGAEDEIKKLKNRFPKLDIHLRWTAPPAEDPIKQGALMITALYDSTDAIIISPFETGVLKEAIRMARDSGIPVFTYDNDIPSSERTAYIGPDQQKIGEWLLLNLAERMRGDGAFVIYAGNAQSDKYRQRIAGIEKAMEVFPGLHLESVIQHNEDPLASVNAVKKLYEDGKGPDGIIFLESWPFCSNDLLESGLLKDTKIVTVNAFPSLFPYLEKGLVQASMGQATFMFGGEAVKLAVDKLYLGKEIDTLNTMKTIPVTINNLGGWSRQFRAWGQDGIDEKYLTM